MLGKLSWEAIPFDQPIPLVAAGWSASDDHGGLALGHAEGMGCPTSGGSGSPASTTSGSASCTSCSRW